MKTSKQAYDAKPMIFESNDRSQNVLGIGVGDLIVQDGIYSLVTSWTRNAVTGEVTPAAMHRLDPKKLQALHGGRATHYYPDPIPTGSFANPN